MARGVRKSPLEKLQIGLEEVQNSIRQYEECLETLKAQEIDLFTQIELEEFKALKAVMDESGMTLEEVKALIHSQNETRQSA